MNVDSVVSTDLSSMGKASGHPMRSSIYLLPAVEVSHSVTKSMAILLNGHSGISVICKE